MGMATKDSLSSKTMSFERISSIITQEPDLRPEKQEGGQDDGTDRSDVECKIVVVGPSDCEIVETNFEVFDGTTIEIAEASTCSEVLSTKAASQSPLHVAEAHPVFETTVLHAIDQCTLLVDGSADSSLSHTVYVRPEYIFASTVLEDDDETSIDHIGIILENRSRGGVLVAGFSQDSPFLGSNIQPGDRVVAINYTYCADCSLDRVEELIEASKEKLSICVHNKNGDPCLVSSSITKPSPTVKVGITLRRRIDVIRIKEIVEGSLFNDTLMTPTQRCRSINGVPCEHLTAHSASSIIGDAPKRVTIETELQPSCAVTIGVHEHAAWWHKVASGMGILPVRACTELSLLEH